MKHKLKTLAVVAAFAIVGIVATSLFTTTPDKLVHAIVFLTYATIILRALYKELVK